MSRIFLSAPDMAGTERELVMEAFDSNYVAPAGPMIERFERDIMKYTGFENAVALTTATAALHLAMIVCGVKKGDEVWSASATFMGGIAPVAYVGASPVFFDSDPKDWTLDVELIVEQLELAEKENRLPKVILSTDLYGQSCDLDPLIAACDAYDISLISDSAEALGALYKGRHAGKGAKLAAISFNGNKIITTSGGGILLSDNPELIERAKYYSTQARQPFPHYEHTDIGYNYRMSNISAAIGVGQLQQIEQKVERRRAIFARYADAFGQLPGVTMMPEPDGLRSTRWLSCMLVDAAAANASSEEIRLKCDSLEIEVRPLWKPMHMQPVFKGTKFVGSGFCEKLFSDGMCLPSGSGMADDEQTKVIETILSLLDR